MSKSERAGNSSGGFSMFDALLRDHIKRRYGTQKEFAKKLGVNEQTVSRWLRRETDPLGSNATERTELVTDLGVELDLCAKLGEVSVGEACQVVLDKLASEDPVEISIQERFHGLLAEKGDAIPAAAFVVFLTGDQASRQGVVETLEQMKLNSLL